MHLAELQAFVQIATSGSFSAAAEQLHLTQPAISKRIANLETTLNTVLFDRIGRQIIMTEAGRTLLPRAQNILHELIDCQRALANLTGHISGTLTIATSHHIGLHHLPPLLREFATRYPDVQLDMRFTDSELGCEAVIRGEAELAIITLPLQPNESLYCLPVWHDPLAIVVNQNHALAATSHITAQQLADYPAILPGEITFTRRLVDQFFQQHNIALRIAFATNYLETIKMMVAVGLGWSVLPQSMVDSDIIRLSVRSFKVSRTLGAVHHTGHTLSNAAQKFISLLENKIQR